MIKKTVRAICSWLLAPIIIPALLVYVVFDIVFDDDNVRGMLPDYFKAMFLMETN